MISLKNTSCRLAWANVPDKSKLIVFDGFINLSHIYLENINNGLISGSKLGFNVQLIDQNYVEVNKTIVSHLIDIIMSNNDNVGIDRMV